MENNQRTIIRLDKKTINKIAAGEVVERPASVVKELIENSIDAGATEINVVVEGYGLDLIKVVDNGCGMGPEDAEIAWKSHTTSKLRSVEDLTSISSLGFRGEALASIAAVSIMEIITRQEEQSTGVLIRVKGGELVLMEEKECAPGTTVIVRNLFYNVPARKKFLKTPATELGHIIEITTRQALIHPEIHFRLRHNQSELLNSPRSNNPLEPIISVFGVEVAKKMLKVAYEKDGIIVEGFTSLPEESRSSRNHEIIYVNKRFIKSKLLSEAIEEAYKTLLMRNRFPVSIINLELDSSKVDVNIHPTKREVRFDNANKIFDIIKEAIVKALQAGDLWREEKRLVIMEGGERGETNQAMLSLDEKEAIIGLSAQEITTIEEPLGGQKKEEIKAEIGTIFDTQLTFEQPVGDSDWSGKDIPSGESLKESVSSLPKDKMLREPLLQAESMTIKLTDSFWVKPLGQVLNLYVLCETVDGIAIVDLHAAHERVRYEQLTELFLNSKIEAQELLAPITFQVPPETVAFIIDYLPELKKLGVDLESFGGNTFVIRKLPVVMDLVKTEEDIRDFIDEVGKEVPVFKDVNERLDHTLKIMACHSTVRAGERVTMKKIIEILTKLSTCHTPFSCPHGRPTIIRISRRKLEKEFGRIA